MKRIVGLILTVVLVVGGCVTSTYASEGDKKEQLATRTISTDGYIHNERFKDAIIHNGIDVSRYQGDIDWNAVKNSGIEFAFIRVGYRGYGSGSLNEDSYARANLSGAQAAGIKIGAYIFSQAITTNEAREEAAYILNYVRDYNITMPIVMDYEYVSTDNGTAGRLYDADLSQRQTTDIVNAFGEYVKNSGYEPMIYANEYMLSSKLYADEIAYKVWLANYTTQTAYEGSYEFWQYTSSGDIDGIGGRVDCNFWYEMPDKDDSKPQPNPEPNPDAQPNGWVVKDGKKYWYDYGVLARNKEAYDPESDAWYWFDDDGAMATNKDVFIPTNADRTEGKWVRYDENGHMIKGEDYRYGGWYWFDPITGEMCKGFMNIPDNTPEGKWVYYDLINGQMYHGEACINGNWYYFDDYTGKMVHGEYYWNESWYYYDIITGIMAHGWTELFDGRVLHYDEWTGKLV